MFLNIHGYTRGLPWAIKFYRFSIKSSVIYGRMLMLIIAGLNPHLFIKRLPGKRSLSAEKQ